MLSVKSYLCRTTTEETIALKDVELTTVKQQITYPEETTSSFDQSFQDYLNQLSHESTTTTDEQMTSPGGNPIYDILSLKGLNWSNNRRHCITKNSSFKY